MRYYKGEEIVMNLSSSDIDLVSENFQLYIIKDNANFLIINKDSMICKEHEFIATIPPEVSNLMDVGIYRIELVVDNDNIITGKTGAFEIINKD